MGLKNLLLYLLFVVLTKKGRPILFRKRKRGVSAILQKLLIGSDVNLLLVVRSGTRLIRSYSSRLRAPGSFLNTSQGWLNQRQNSRTILV